MTRLSARLRWVALTFLLLIGLAAAACGGDGDGASDGLAVLETGACANQGGGTVVVAQIAEEAEHGATVAYVIEYLAEFGFSYPTRVRSMTLAEAATGIADCSVHLLAAPSGWTASGAKDYGTLYEGASGPINKYAVAQLGELAPEFSEAYTKMEIPLRRIEETTEWYNSDERPWVRFTEGQDERYAPAQPWKAAVYFYWEFDLTDGSWKAWLGGVFEPFDQIRKVTQAVTREIRGTPYKGEDQYEDSKGNLDLDEDGSILLDSRTKVTTNGDLALR